MGNNQSCNMTSMGHTCNYLASSVDRYQYDCIVLFCYESEGRDVLLISPLVQKDTLALPSIPAQQRPSSAVSSDHVSAGHTGKRGGRQSRFKAQCRED